MSHFYAFDRKQSMKLLFAGILLAALVFLLGWIVGMLMRSSAPGPVAVADSVETPAETHASESPSAEMDATSTAAGDGSRSTPPPSPDGEGPAEEEASPPRAVPEDAVPEASSDEPPTEDFGPRNRYAVVAADFAVESKARELRDRLLERGYEARMVHTPAEATAGRMGLHSVILGDYARRETAMAAAEQLRGREQTTAVVRTFPASALEPPSETEAISPPGTEAPEAPLSG
jgi:cell division septation protein DedD